MGCADGRAEGVVAGVGCVFDEELVARIGLAIDPGTGGEVIHLQVVRVATGHGPHGVEGLHLVGALARQVETVAHPEFVGSEGPGIHDHTALNPIGVADR